METIPSDLNKQLSSLLKELPEHDRLILALYYHENLTLIEIGSVMSISEEDVTKRMDEILKRLRGQLTN